jgi:hypothetical protein
MSKTRGSESGVWQQLRRRRVTRTVVTYLAVAFAVIEATWYAVPRFGLVEDVGRLVMGALVLGFPFTVVLAWTYDLTPSGVVRTPEDGPAQASEASSGRLRRSAWLLLCVVVVAIGYVLRSLRM